MKTEAQIYAEVLDSVRNLTKFYLSGLKGIDVHKSMEIGEQKFNSPYWIAAHLTWSEHSLLLEGLGAENMNIPWLEEFSIGTEPPAGNDLPDYEDILKTMETVHEKATNKVKSLTDDELDEKNLLGFAFGGSDSKRAIIKHCIRHEPMHVGQISWYLKINKVEMP